MVIQSDDGRNPNFRLDAPDVGFRAFLEALGVAVYTTNADGVITDYNEAAVALWGRRPAVGRDEWCGSWKLFWADGEPMRHDQCPMAIALHENRAVRGYEAIAERPDGTRVCFIPYPTPLRDGAGRLIGAVNVLVDITERNYFERAVLDHQRRLEEALAAKDAFLGLVSHELRTPITSILGNAEILHERGATLKADDQAVAMRDIFGEAMRLERIVSDLLTLARFEGGGLEAEPVAVGRLLGKVISDYLRTSAREISYEDRSEGRVAYGGDGLVAQVLRNYLSNAERYSPPGSAIEVVLEQQGEALAIRVLNAGTSIDPAEQDRLFEPFYRSADVAAVSGLGIGLAVCRRLVEAVGGSVWAVPRVKGGSEFGFKLQLCSETDSS